MPSIQLIKQSCTLLHHLGTPTEMKSVKQTPLSLSSPQIMSQSNQFTCNSALITEKRVVDLYFDQSSSKSRSLCTLVSEVAGKLIIIEIEPRKERKLF